MEKTSAISVVESFSDMLSRDQKLASDVRVSAVSRLVWYVAIAGFIMVNAKPYWEILRGHQLVRYEILWLALPWIATALSAVFTHFLFDVVAVKDNKYYSNKKSLIDLHRMDVEDSKPNIDKWTAIMYDTDRDLARLKKDVNWWANLAQGFEMLTHALMIIAFLLSLVIFPLAL